MLCDSAHISFDEFQTWQLGRPKHERAELLDGRIIELPREPIAHQRIARHLVHALSGRIAAHFSADMLVLVRTASQADTCLVPDVTVIGRDIALGQVYAERFYFVAEVLSRDRPDVLAKKRAYYQGHEHCRGFMFVKQNEVSAELVCRTADGWSTAQLTDPDAVIDIPDIGAIGRLRALYRSTPLEPAGTPNKTRA